MKNLIKNAILTTATAALLFNAGAAEAKIKEVKFHVVQSDFEDLAYMEMKFENGKWNWVSQSKNFNTRIKVFFKASGYVRHTARVSLTDSNATLWALPANYYTNNHEELTTMTVGKSILSPFQGKAKALCDVFGGSVKSVRQMDVNAQMNVVNETGIDSAKKNGPFPIRVICQPKPNDPQRTPVDLKVTQLKLYTIPAQPVCGQPVQLITEIWTNKPGKVDFLLTRADGPKQAAAITTNPVSGGYVNRWAKTYTHEKSVNLRYQVVLAKQAMASNWTDMKVSCGAGADIAKPKKLAN